MRFLLASAPTRRRFLRLRPEFGFANYGSDRNESGKLQATRNAKVLPSFSSVFLGSMGYLERGCLIPGCRIQNPDSFRRLYLALIQVCQIVAFG